MSAVELLAQLRQLDIVVRLDGEQLQIEGPRHALTPELRERLARSKSEIIAFLRASVQTLVANQEPIQSVPRSQRLLLSHAQQRLWFLDQLEPGSSAYVMSSAVRLRGDLDVRVLEASLTELLCRHEALRTIFSSREGAPFQIVREPVPVPLPFVDLGDFSLAERHEQLQRLLDENASSPFDLSIGPLCRFELVRLADRDFVLLLAFHHIIFDGWSAGVFGRELSAIYKAFLSGSVAPLAQPRLQYADFAHWQQRRLDSGGRSRHLQYWQRQLSGELPTLALPMDRPRPPQQSGSAGRCSARVDAELLERVRCVGRNDSATVSMTLLAAFSVLLHRLSGQDDLLIGAPVAGRERRETENMIGFFVNTIVLRSEYAAGASFREHLRSTRETLLGAYAHQDMPFEELVSAFDSERDLSRTPLFQVFFNHINLDVRPFDFPGVEAEAYGETRLKSKFDLTLYAHEEKDGVTLLFVYNSSIFDADRMTEMLEQYRSILEQVSLDPSRRVDSYSLVTSQAATVLPDPAAPLPTLVKLQTDRTLTCRHIAAFAERAALVAADGIWTYARMDLYADRLARELRRAGIRRGDIVAIFASRDPRLACAILGVLRAGAAFAILDSSYPDARLEQSWRVADPRALLRLRGAGQAGPRLSQAVAESVVCCDIELGHELEGLGHDLPSDDPVEVGPNDWAYIAFTSGTTGALKGVIGTHGPVVHFLEWQRLEFGLRQQDRFAMLAGLSHDPLLRDIFGALWIGAELHIPASEVFAEPSLLTHWLIAHQVTIAHLTPAMAQLLSIAAGSERLNSLRLACVGGDRFAGATAREFQAVAPNACLVNFYGATETPQAIAYRKLGVRDMTRSAAPLGQGIDAVQLLVLARGGGLAGVGEAGEIIVRTPYLALGYRNDDALTADRFVTNTATNISADRVYRTGDLGRFLPDGAVEFVGRRDGQVKIRGFRVELGEVEAALRQHPSVVAAVAVPVIDKDVPGAWLAAFVVLAEERPAGSAELLSHIASLLPSYAVPASITALDKLPLTPNGKIDRRALLRPDMIGNSSGDAGDRPLTLLENQLLAIWRQELRRPDLQHTDNFFEHGGTSLVAVRLFSQLRKVFGRDLPLATLFRAPSVGKLASLMVGEGHAARWKSLIAIQPSGAKPPLFLVPGIGGNVLEFARLANLLGTERPFYATQSRGLDGREPPMRRIEDMAIAYIKELREVQAHGPYFLGGACMGGVIAFEMAQQLIRAGEPVAFLALLDTPFAGAAHRRRRVALSLLRPVLFVLQAMRRHIANMRAEGWQGYLTGLQKVSRIAFQVLRQRDVYRGDRNAAYQHGVTAANFEAMVAYRPSEYPDQIHLVIASERRTDPGNKTRLAWENFAKAGCSVFRIKARDSGELLQPPYVMELAEILRDALSSVERDTAERR